MTDEFILDDKDRDACERALNHYHAQWFTPEENAILAACDPLDAGIEIGFKAAWAYLQGKIGALHEEIELLGRGKE